MLERVLLDNIWAAITLCTVCYFAIYLLSLHEIHLYHTKIKEIIVIPQRYILRPETQTFIAQRKWFNWKVTSVLIVQAIGLWAAWQATVGQNQRQDVFAIILGGALLLELAAIALHLRTIAFFNDVAQNYARGKIEYAPRLMATQALSDLYIFTALYLFAFLITGSWLFLGGALTGFIASRGTRDERGSAKSALFSAKGDKA